MTRLTIDAEYLAKVLKKLLSIPSPTGYTDTIVRYVTKELTHFGLNVELTRRGAIRAVRHGGTHLGARAVVAHVDTLGAQVKFLKDNGRLALVPIGTWSARFAEGARATIFTEKGAYRGTILPLKASGHTFNDEVDQLPIGWDYVEMRVDALSRNAGDLSRLGFEVGDIRRLPPCPSTDHVPVQAGSLADLPHGGLLIIHLGDEAANQRMRMLRNRQLSAPSANTNLRRPLSGGPWKASPILGFLRVFHGYHLGDQRCSDSSTSLWISGETCGFVSFFRCSQNPLNRPSRSESGSSGT